MSSVVETAERTAHQVKDTAVHTRGSLVELGAQALRFLNDVRAAEVRGVDTVLGRLGLQRRESSLRPILWFLAGAATAGAIVFVLAPTQGKKLRERITKALEERDKKPGTNGATAKSVTIDKPPIEPAPPH